MSNVYYQDELRYLREVGPEFAKTNPEIARLLADRGSDPDVERMLEGVAFLCGRIRQKLDDELPELTAGIMSLLWPHYLRSIPSMSILELRPDLDALRGPLSVQAGADFASVPIDGTRCRYRSCWSETLRPWALQKIRLETEAAKPVRLVMQFQSAAAAALEDLELERVRLHLAGDPAAAFALYLLLAAHVSNVVVSDGSASHKRPEEMLAPECVRAAGLSRGEAVLPYPTHSFSGYRLLQEYFAFKERFLFIEISGLDRAVRRLELENSIEVAVTFSRRLETYPLVSVENVRLHCVPIINLFEHPADPVRLEHDRVEYLIQPSKTGISDRRHAEVYSVDSVSGVNRGADYETREYLPFHSFSHHLGDESVQAYYQVHVVPNVSGGEARLGTDTYVSFISPSADGKLPAAETASLELTCTNRYLPAELRAGDIREPTDSSPPGISFHNLIKPTATIPPPMGKGLHWRLISHMSLNYVSLASAERFRELLRVYDFQQEHDVQQALAHQRLLEGIRVLRSTSDERMVRGAPIRGVQINMELDEDHFAGEGDAYLFASVLDRFFGLYVTLNAYSQLTVRFSRSGQVQRFAPRWGDQLTPADAKMGETAYA